MTYLEETRTGNAPGGEAGGAQNKNYKGYGNSSTTKVIKQPLPIPGTCLCAYLKRYKADLLSCEPSREISTAMDCVDFLLMLAEVRP